MAIFNSYVKLPEGTQWQFIWNCIPRNAHPAGSRLAALRRCCLRVPQALHSIQAPGKSWNLQVFHHANEDNYGKLMKIMHYYPRARCDPLKILYRIPWNQMMLSYALQLWRSLQRSTQLSFLFELGLKVQDSNPSSTNFNQICNFPVHTDVGTSTIGVCKTVTVYETFMGISLDIQRHVCPAELPVCLWKTLWMARLGNGFIDAASCQLEDFRIFDAIR